MFIIINWKWSQKIMQGIQTLENMFQNFWTKFKVEGSQCNMSLESTFHNYEFWNQVD